jgi:beta-glucuronidase
MPVRFSLIDPPRHKEIIDGEALCDVGLTHHIKMTLPRERVRLWSCDDPYLYELRVSVGTDLWHDRVGLREVRTQGRNILLNGESVILRGVNVLPDDPIRGEFSVSDSTATRTLDLVESLHCNFVRSHRPLSWEFVRACDERGALLWQEVPAYWLRAA